MSSLAQSASQTAQGVMQSVLTAANVLTSTINLANIAAAAGNIKANAWLDEVKLSTSLESKYSAARIEDEVTDKVAVRIMTRQRAMQDPAYAAAYSEAQKYLKGTPEQQTQGSQA